jgi:hypothetical protein
MLLWPLFAARVIHNMELKALLSKTGQTCSKTR